MSERKQIPGLPSQPHGRPVGKISRRDVLKVMSGLGMVTGLGAGSLGAGERTTISVEGNQFFLNGIPTYRGRTYRGMKMEGLLMNSRMVNGIFDDLNPATRPFWNYPDTGKWDPARNTREFVAAMPEWRRHGLLSFTIDLQGGNPRGYMHPQPWYNSAFDSEGTLRKEYMHRLKDILDKADNLGMAPILGYFYFGQDHQLQDESAVKRGTEAATSWVLQNGYRNVMIEISNECDGGYRHDILRSARVHELIKMVRSMTWRGERLLVGTSFSGGKIPTDRVLSASDFVLIHGNDVTDPARITGMVDQVRRLPSYHAKPILFNEDDHYDFDKPDNNMVAAVRGYASWGLLDIGENNYRDGYQSPPVNWSINTERKQGFFGLLREMTGS